jgi:hypothetical protein
MTRIFSGFVLGFSVVAASVTVAGAQDLTSQVSAGKRTLIGQFALYSTDTCYAGPTPDARVGTAPEHGKLDFTEERVTTNAGNCGKMTISFRRVYYTPKPGFRGQDHASVNFIYNAFSDAPRMTNRGQSYAITVK